MEKQFGSNNSKWTKEERRGKLIELMSVNKADVMVQITSQSVVEAIINALD